MSLLLSLALAAAAPTPACVPDALGTSRVLTLPRAAGDWGTAQHAPLPGLGPKEVVLTFDDGPRPESTPSCCRRWPTSACRRPSS